MSKTLKNVTAGLALVLGIGSGVCADLGFVCTAIAMLACAAVTFFVAPMFFEL